MPIFYMQYEATPLPESDDFEECGGAYINCWVRAESESEASTLASANIREQQWKIVSVEEECREVTAAYYSENEEGRDYYGQAVQDGECYVFNAWPVGVQDGDDVH
jgi:hypothetical protein